MDLLPLNACRPVEKPRGWRVSLARSKSLYLSLFQASGLDLFMNLMGVAIAGVCVLFAGLVVFKSHGSLVFCLLLALSMVLIAFVIVHGLAHSKRRFVLGERKSAAEIGSESCGALIDVTDPAQPMTPADYYDKVFNLVARNFLHRGSKTVDEWNARKDEFKQRHAGGSFVDAGECIRASIQRLGDNYTSLLDAEDADRMVRWAIEPTAVKYGFLPGNIGYVGFKDFKNRSLVAEVRKALSELSSARAYVIDLRGNGGGLETVCASIFSLFVDESLVCTRRTVYDGCEGMVTVAVRYDGIVVTSECAEPVVTPREPNITGSKPVFVLVNGRSASAAEVLTSALRVARGAKVIGEKTFGKGIGQYVWHLDFNTMLRVTAFALLDAAGQNWHGTGIMPDHQVKNEADVDRQLELAIELAHQSDD